MIKSKKAGKTLDEIGKKWHDFNFKSERLIYSYLCCNRSRLINMELRNLNKDLKFEEYRQWKQYICNKYQNYSRDKLIEFSRYLKLMIRNIKPNHEYWIIMATALLSIVFTMVINVTIELNKQFNINSDWIKILITILSGILFILFSAYLIIKIVYPIFDDYFDENFLRDYKEIIDEIIKERYSK